MTARRGEHDAEPDKHRDRRRRDQASARWPIRVSCCAVAEE